jgi:hypothetical protein
MLMPAFNAGSALTFDNLICVYLCESVVKIFLIDLSNQQNIPFPLDLSVLAPIISTRI